MKTKTIDNHEYAVGSIPATHNWELGCELIEAVGGCLPSAIHGIMGAATAYQLGEGIEKVLKDICRYDPKLKLVLKLLANTQRDGITITKDTFNSFYTSNMSEMFKALYFTCEVHFKHFFPEDLLSGFLAKREEYQKSSVEN
jgi:hypothetical protein